MVGFFKARVFHKRTHPHNGFCYKAGYIVMPLIASFKAPWFFSLNRFNVFSFYNKDHGFRTHASNTLNWVYEKLDEVKISKNQISEVILLTHPRCFGFVFNPVSFYFCLNTNNEPIAIIAEVNNTFSQTHSYIICEQNLSPIALNKTYITPKQFFVSPFYQVEGYYQFRFVYNHNNPKIAVFIDYYKQNALAFETSLTGKVVNFSFANYFPYIFTTFKTVILIGFQAFILKFIKKVKFKKAPPQTGKKTTINTH